MIIAKVEVAHSQTKLRGDRLKIMGKSKNLVKVSFDKEAERWLSKNMIAHIGRICVYYDDSIKEMSEELLGKDTQEHKSLLQRFLSTFKQDSDF